MPVFDNHEYLTQEEKRLKEDRNRTKYWKKWGPYVAERQWATGKSSHNAQHTPCPTARAAKGDPAIANIVSSERITNSCLVYSPRGLQCRR